MLVDLASILKCFFAEEEDEGRKEKSKVAKDEGESGSIASFVFLILYISV